MRLARNRKVIQGLQSLTGKILSRKVLCDRSFHLRKPLGGAIIGQIAGSAQGQMSHRAVENKEESSGERSNFTHGSKRTRIRLAAGSGANDSREKNHGLVSNPRCEPVVTNCIPPRARWRAV